MTEKPIWKPGDAPLMAWYGDDFTGTLAVLEVMAFAGLPGVVYLKMPTAEQKARFDHVAAVGLAGTARAQTPQWMNKNLPEIFKWIAGTDAQLLGYKICSTLDSSPDLGSIGCVADTAVRTMKQETIPCVVAAPWMGRFQAFGSVFASAGDGNVHRLDRHPVMTRHPVTPMDEADIRYHLARQTNMDISILDMTKLGDIDFEWPRGVVALDACTENHMRDVGKQLWEGRYKHRFVIGSQGIQKALISYWQSQKYLPPMTAKNTIVPARTVVVSGSVSPTTQEQIEHAVQNGFVPIRLDPCQLIKSDAEWESSIETTVQEAKKVLESGQNPLIFTAKGPDDPAVAAFNTFLAAQEQTKSDGYCLLGEALGKCLRSILLETDTRRCIVAGGDTSGRVMDILDGYATTAIVGLEPGCSLFKLHTETHLDGLEIMLKGGQMGTPGIFTDVAEGI